MTWTTQLDRRQDRRTSHRSTVHLLQNRLYRRMVRSTDYLKHLDIHQAEVEEVLVRVLESELGSALDSAMVSGWELDSVTALGSAKAPG